MFNRFNRFNMFMGLIGLIGLIGYMEELNKQPLLTASARTCFMQFSWWCPYGELLDSGGPVGDTCVARTHTDNVEVVGSAMPSWP